MRHSITIRFVDARELPLIHDLAHRIWPPTFEKILSKDQIRYMLDWMYNVEKLRMQLEQGHRFAIAEGDGTPLGFIGMEANAPEIGKLRIHKLYVLPETQGMGLGRKLLGFAIDEARRLELSVINLNVNRFNKATKFYKHLGFKVIREENIDIGNGYLMEDFVMERAT